MTSSAAVTRSLLIATALVAGLPLAVPMPASAGTDRHKKPGPCTSEGPPMGHHCRQTGPGVAVYLPAFSGPESIGLNVATVLNLQLVSTLRKAPTPNIAGLSFGSGKVVWNPEPLSELSHQSAEQVTSTFSVPVQMVLWGQALRYADGVIVQANLTLPNPKGEPNPVWKVEVRVADTEKTLKLDFPSRHYNFEPLVLTERLVKLYSSPTALKVYSDKSLREELGFLKEGSFTAERHEKDGEWLAEPIRGWMPLPQLSQEPNEIVEFTGGVVRMFRKDYEGAKLLFQNVLKRTTTPTALRIDTLLYMGLASELRGQSGREQFEQAYSLNPLSHSSAAYLITGAFADHNRASEPAKARELTRIRALLEDNQYLFPADSTWLGDANAAYASAASR
jgi:hypothetical protein